MLKAFIIRAGFAILLAAAAGPLQAQSKLSTVERDRTRPSTKAAETRIYGAGSPIIYPLFSAWMDQYHRQHPGVRFSYQSVGSGGGIRALTDRKVSFAVTSWPMSDDQLARANGRIFHIPLALNAVVPIYNLAQVPKLRFSGSTLADIFLGKIRRWDDAAIAKDNPGVTLPQMNIKVAHHFPDDGQIDTFLMTDYLSKVSPIFGATLANSPRENWPLANSAAGYRGGDGITGFISETPGSIGYVELDRARRNRLRYGSVKNSDGEFVPASAESLTAASIGAPQFVQSQAPDFRVSITNAPGKKSYPIASLIWLVLYEDSNEKKKKEVMNDFLKWVLTDGQRLALKLGYPSLPSNLVEMELQRLRNSGK
jgi:phosphate transport system substrate-binding protein